VNETAPRVSLFVIDPRDRPRTWGDCVEADLGTRELPCPFVGCRHHLAIDAALSKLREGHRTHKPSIDDPETLDALDALDLDTLVATCSLRVATEGLFNLDSLDEAPESDWDPEFSSPRGGADCCTLEETGIVLGLTRERVRQIEAKALGRLRGSARVFAADLEQGIKRPDLRASEASLAGLDDALTAARMKYDPTYAAQREYHRARAKRAHRTGPAPGPPPLPTATAQTTAPVRVLEGEERRARIEQIERENAARAARKPPRRPFSEVLAEPIPERPLPTIQQTPPPTEIPMQRETTESQAPTQMLAEEDETEVEAEQDDVPPSSKTMSEEDRALLEQAIAKAGGSRALSLALGKSKNWASVIKSNDAPLSTRTRTVLNAFLSKKKPGPKPKTSRVHLANPEDAEKLQPEKLEVASDGLEGKLLALLQPLIEARAEQLVEQHPEVLRARKILDALKAVA